VLNFFDELRRRAPVGHDVSGNVAAGTPVYLLQSAE
jgi:hypothetical protein